eukprot:2574514-Rhodomonas_salina.1
MMCVLRPRSLSLCAETDELIEQIFAVGSGRNHTMADTFKRLARGARDPVQLPAFRALLR